MAGRWTGWPTAQHRRDRMIPALPGTAVRHQAEQFQQVTGAATRRRHRSHNRLTISRAGRPEEDLRWRGRLTSPSPRSRPLPR